MDQHNAVVRSYPIPGQTWPTELRWLYQQFSRSKTHAEIGVYCGRSLFASCAGMRGGDVFAVDMTVASVPGGDHPDAAWIQSVRNATVCAIKLAAPIQVECMNTGSLDAARELFRRGVQLDSVFIDGSHEYEHVDADIGEWLPLIRQGGIISGHDYSTAFPGVIRAVTERISWFQVVPGTRIWHATVT